MYFGARDFDESTTFDRPVKDRRSRTKLDFPIALAKRFENFVFSIFVLDTERKRIEVCYSIDSQQRIWIADFLIRQELDAFLKLEDSCCSAVYYNPTSLHCLTSEPAAQAIGSVMETDHAVVLSAELGSGLRLFLVAHVPCGYSDALFRGVLAYVEEISGGFETYAEELVFGRNKADLSTVQYWIKHIKSPALAFFGNGVVFAQNAAMKNALQSGSDLKVMRGRLVAPAGLSTHFNLLEGSTSLKTGTGRQSQAGVLNLPGSAQYYLEAIPSFSQDSPLVDPVRTFFGKKLLIATTHRPAEVAPSAIKAATGVTLQQARIIQKVVSGKTVKQAAAEIGISYNTARNHIAMAQQRLGMNSLIELVNKVSNAIQIAPDK
jgi:DNA-binding CsgD family transcriptional regulator